MADMDKHPDAIRLIDVIQRRAKLLREIEQMAALSNPPGTGPAAAAPVDAELHAALKELLEYMTSEYDISAWEGERPMSSFMGFLDTGFRH